MKKTLITFTMILSLASLASSLHAADSALKSSSGDFDWNQRIAKANALPSNFNKSMGKVLSDINPEVSPNAYFGIQMNKGVQLGLQLKF